MKTTQKCGNDKKIEKSLLGMFGHQKSGNSAANSNPTEETVLGRQAKRNG